jgi:hypothetical protein
MLADRPETARWLTDEDRLNSERVGSTEVLDKMDKKKFLRGIFNPVTLTTSWVFLLACKSSKIPKHDCLNETQT